MLFPFAGNLVAAVAERSAESISMDDIVPTSYIIHGISKTTGSRDEWWRQNTLLYILLHSPNYSSLHSSTKHISRVHSGVSDWLFYQYTSAAFEMRVCCKIRMQCAAGNEATWYMCAAELSSFQKPWKPPSICLWSKFCKWNMFHETLSLHNSGDKPLTTVYYHMLYGIYTSPNPTLTPP